MSQTTFYIYHISPQNYKQEYDIYSDAVVVAESMEQARHISPSQYHKWSEELKSWTYDFTDGKVEVSDHESWTHPDNVFVELIGTADSKYITPQVICSSFHAG